MVHFTLMYVDEIRLSSLTYFDRMQFCEKHTKGLCSMIDKACRRFYRIFTAHLVKVSFWINLGGRRWTE